jgi:2'-5' RNA ligase
VASDSLAGPGDKSSLFLALPPPLALLARLPALISGLESGTWTLRPVEPEDFHLTLHFLGATPARLVDDLRREIGALCHARRAFDLEAGGLGCFPDERNPRVVWLGIRDRAGKLEDLFQASRRVLMGYRLYDLRAELVPHLTLARVEKLSAAWDPRLLRGLVSQWSDLGVFPVEEVRLMRSRPPSTAGPRYETLAGLGLGGQ